MAEMRKNRGRFEICKIQIVTMIQTLFAMASPPSKKPNIDLGSSFVWQPLCDYLGVFFDFFQEDPFF